MTTKISRRDVLMGGLAAAGWAATGRLGTVRAEEAPSASRPDRSAEAPSQPVKHVSPMTCRKLPQKHN